MEEELLMDLEGLQMVADYQVRVVNTTLLSIYLASPHGHT